MARIAVILAVLTAALGGGVAARAADSPGAGPALVAKLVACDVTSANRAATFYARMDSIPGASRLSIRFQLLERLGRGEAWSKLDLPALKQWHVSQAGVQRYGWKQTVGNLHVGGAYKARVQYRWASDTGVLVLSQTRETPVCRGPLPNIAIADLAVKPGPTADTRVYRVTVQNSGKLDADSVNVSLSVDKAVLDTVAIPHLAAGDARTISFTGPACRRGLRVTADPGNSIGETIEGDNSQLFACP
jgi:hypothetical protein